jgi:hypothetical protein
MAAPLEALPGLSVACMASGLRVCVLQSSSPLDSFATCLQANVLEMESEAGLTHALWRALATGMQDHPVHVNWKARPYAVALEHDSLALADELLLTFHSGGAIGCSQDDLDLDTCLVMLRELALGEIMTTQEESVAQEVALAEQRQITRAAFEGYSVHQVLAAISARAREAALSEQARLTEALSQASMSSQDAAVASLMQLHEKNFRMENLALLVTGPLEANDVIARVARVFDTTLVKITQRWDDIYVDDPFLSRQPLLCPGQELGRFHVASVDNSGVAWVTLLHVADEGTADTKNLSATRTMGDMRINMLDEMVGLLLESEFCTARNANGAFSTAQERSRALPGFDWQYSPN